MLQQLQKIYTSMLQCEDNERQGSLLDEMMDWMVVDEYQDFIPVEQLSAQFVS